MITGYACNCQQWSRLTDGVVNVNELAKHNNAGKEISFTFECI